MTDAIKIVAQVIVTAALGGLVAKGWLTAEDLANVVTYVAGILGIAVMAVWAVLQNRLAPLLARVAKKPEVTEIVVDDPDLAASVPSNKVVSE